MAFLNASDAEHVTTERGRPLAGENYKEKRHAIRST